MPCKVVRIFLENRRTQAVLMTQTFDRVYVIVNPVAGSRRPVLARLPRLFEERGVQCAVSLTQRSGDGERLAQVAVAGGADLVVVLGGDGTIAEVASGLASTGVPLGIVPGGTANILAVELGIPTHWGKAFDLIFESEHRLRSLDMGRIGKRSFLIRASAGYEAAIIAKTRQPFKNRLGPWGYGIGAVRALNARLRARFRLRLDGKVCEISGFNVFIANAGSIGRLGLVLSSRIRPDDGLLDVILLDFAPPSMLRMLASAIRFDTWARALQHWQVREVTIEADSPQAVHADGEAIGRTPLTATVLPGAVEVIVPT